MSEFPIPPEVVEAAIKAAMGAPTLPEGFEAAIRAADKVRGLREEYGCFGQSPASGHASTHVRLVSNWRQVDAEPVADRRSGRERRSEANSPRSEMLPQRRSEKERRQASSDRVDSEPSEPLTQMQLNRLAHLLTHPEEAEALLDPAERAALRQAAESVREGVTHWSQVSAGFIAGRFMAVPSATSEGER